MTLPYRLVLKNLRKRNFHTSLCNSLFYESPDKDGYRIKSDAEIEWEKMSFKERVTIEAKLFKESISQWTKQLVGGALRGPNVIVPAHEVDVIWRFSGDPKELDKWVITTDKDHNQGFSSAQ